MIVEVVVVVVVVLVVVVLPLVESRNGLHVFDSRSGSSGSARGCVFGSRDHLDEWSVVTAFTTSDVTCFGGLAQQLCQACE